MSKADDNSPAISNSSRPARAIDEGDVIQQALLRWDRCKDVLPHQQLAQLYPSGFMVAGGQRTFGGDLGRPGTAAVREEAP